MDVDEWMDGSSSGLKENGRHVEMARCEECDGRGRTITWKTGYTKTMAQIASTGWQETAAIFSKSLASTLHDNKVGLAGLAKLAIPR